MTELSETDPLLKAKKIPWNIQASEITRGFYVLHPQAQFAFPLEIEQDAFLGIKLKCGTLGVVEVSFLSESSYDSSMIFCGPDRETATLLVPASNVATITSRCFSDVVVYAAAVKSVAELPSLTSSLALILSQNRIDSDSGITAKTVWLLITPLLFFALCLMIAKRSQRRRLTFHGLRVHVPSEADESFNNSKIDQQKLQTAVDMRPAGEDAHGQS